MNKSTICLIFVSFLAGCQIKPRLEEVASEKTNTQSQFALGVPLRGAIETVGASSVEFIPEKPISIAGFGGLGRRFFPPLFSSQGELSFCRPYEKLVDPPKIKVAVLGMRDTNDNLKNIYIVSLDIVAVTADLTQAIHETINQIPSTNEANLNNTVVLATHTHSGPAGLTENPLWGAFVCDQFNKSLRDSYLNLVKLALKDAIVKSNRITTIETIRSFAPQSLTSRFNGMNPAHEVSLMSFKSKDGTIPLALLRMAVHPTYYGQSELTLSADLVAPLEKATINAFSASEVFLVQTELGNMNSNLNNQSPSEWAKEIANTLKENGTTLSSKTLTFSSQSYLFSLPRKEINWKSCNAAYAESIISLNLLEKLPSTIPISIWNFDGEVNAFMSGEWTTSAAALIKSTLQKKFKNSGFFNIVSLANDYTAYHVSKDFYDQEYLESCSSIYGKNMLEQLNQDLEAAEIFP